MRRSAIRRYLGASVNIRTPGGEWSGRVDAVPRGFAVIDGISFPLDTLEGSEANGQLELRTWDMPNTLAALLQAEGRPIRGASVNFSVSPRSAVENTIAVYACVSLRAEMIGALPAHLYSRVSDTRRQEVDYGMAYPGSLSRMVGEQPNPEMTAPEFWETVVGHHDLWGNFYGNLERDLADGRPRYVWPLNPAMTTAIWDKKTGRKWLKTHIPGTTAPKYLKPEEFVHIRGPISTDGVNGLSPIGVARTSVGTEQAAGEHNAALLANGAEPGGVLTVPGKLDPDDRKAIDDRWNARHGGMTNANRVAVLGGGVTWQSVGMNNHDAEFLEGRRWEVEQIARLYRVPPHMIQDITKQSSWGTGIEVQNLGLHTYTLRPVIVRIESGLGRDLGFPQSGKLLADEDLYIAFDVSHFLRADALTQAQVLAIQRQWGVINANEWRADLDMEPIPGAAGEEYINPANFNPLLPGQALPLPSANGNGKTPAMSNGG